MLWWTVNSVRIQPAAHPVFTGTYRDLEKVINSWFMMQAAAGQELHLDSVAVDLTVITLWL